MVGRVLTKERRVTEREGNDYSLRGFSDLSTSQVNELIELCDSRLKRRIQKSD
jgi:ATP adenylyltransferase